MFISKQTLFTLTLPMYHSTFSLTIGLIYWNIVGFLVGIQTKEPLINWHDSGVGLWLKSRPSHYYVIRIMDPLRTQETSRVIRGMKHRELFLRRTIWP